MKPIAKYFNDTKIVLIKYDTTTITVNNVELHDINHVLKNHSFKVNVVAGWDDYESYKVAPLILIR